MTTIYEREKRYNSEAGGRLAEDQRDTQENVEKVNNSRECQQKGLQLQILLHGDFLWDETKVHITLHVGMKGQHLQKLYLCQTVVKSTIFVSFSLCFEEFLMMSM